MTGMDAALPIAGITVVELGHSLAGPYAGWILAGLGAEVIKVENPEGGDYARDWGPPWMHGTSSLYQALNRDKTGIAVDLGDDADCARLRALVLDRADVFLQNLRAGAVAKKGLGAAELLAAKPSLIYCSVGAFGAAGPLADRPGYDPLMQAAGGIMSVTGEAGGAPVRVGTSVIDMGAGMWAVNGVLAALHRRAATGLGGHVETSLFETALAWMGTHIAGYLASGEVRRPYGSGVAEIVPHQAFEARDGWLMIAAGNDNMFHRLCTVLGHPEWPADARFASNGVRVANRETIIVLIGAVIATDGREAWLARIDAAGVPCAPILSVDKVVDWPQTVATGMIQRAPDADMALVGLPLSFDGVRPPYRRSAPTLGQHTDEILGAGHPGGKREDR